MVFESMGPDDDVSVSGNASYVSGNVPDGYAPGITLEELRMLLIELGIGKDPDAEEEEEEPEEAESVSGNGVPDTVSGNGMSDTVSGNSVSCNGILTDIYGEVQTLKKEDVSIWEKPLEDYTVTEGLLFLMFLLLLGLFFGRLLKGGEKYV